MQFKRRYKVLAVAFAAYFSWVGVLSFVILEPSPQRLAFSVIYGVPMAVELAIPVSGLANEFCQSKSATTDCDPLKSRALEQLYYSGRYKIGPGAQPFPGEIATPNFFTGNRICKPSQTFFSINCLRAFKGLGPKGEEFYLCHRPTSGCYFPELNGVRYEYG